MSSFLSSWYSKGLRRLHSTVLFFQSLFHQVDGPREEETRLKLDGIVLVDIKRGAPRYQHLGEPCVVEYWHIFAPLDLLLVLDSRLCSSFRCFRRVSV